MDESVYDLSVYDMGASQPTLATPRPAEPVATFANLTFRRANAALGGVSCMAINATHTWNNALDTSLQPYFDNIRVKSRQTGSIIHIR
jgi:hypothetical protein